MTAPTTTVATKPEVTQHPIVAAIERFYPLVSQALPKQADSERFKRLVLTTLRKTPQLLAATPESFVGALFSAAALGLEPGTPRGECHLVPYRDRKKGIVECQLIVGYPGYAKLFWQNPLAAQLSAEYVCQNDVFEYSKGLNPSLHHVAAVGDRGPVVCYYAIVGLNSGARMFDVFTPEQIKALRGGKVGTSGDIRDPEHWMERKSALRQVLKLAPQSTQLQQMLSVDERVGSVSAIQVLADGGTPDLPYADSDPVDAELVDAETGEVLT